MIGIMVVLLSFVVIGLMWRLTQADRSGVLETCGFLSPLAWFCLTPSRNPTIIVRLHYIYGYFVQDRAEEWTEGRGEIT